MVSALIKCLTAATSSLEQTTAEASRAIDSCAPGSGRYGCTDNDLEGEGAWVGDDEDKLPLSRLAKLRSDSAAWNSSIDCVIRQAFGANQCDELLRKIQALRNKAVAIEVRIMASCRFVQVHVTTALIASIRGSSADVASLSSFTTMYELVVERGVELAFV
jgi:hypothetical protein